MTHKLLILSASVSMLSLGACATTQTTSESFGVATRQNIAVQFVQPTEEQKENTYIRPDAQRMATARENYRKDEVEEPEDLSTID